MQFLSINKKTTLLDLIKSVGTRNVDSVLALNSLPRTAKIGAALDNLYKNQGFDSEPNVEYQKKVSILNTLTDDSDIFESASMLSEYGWKILAAFGSLPNMIRIPETIKLPDSPNILGNGEPVSKVIYEKAISMLSDDKIYKHTIDPSIFNEYSSARGSQIVDSHQMSNPIQWFNLPWGKITLYSSLGGDSMDFPVFPDEFKNSNQANYDTMPDTIYQYEPWQVYKSSGPRTNTFTFNMHRDMWTGNHLDGKCNELIRFCQANCYPEFKGAAVQTSTVTLYIAGKPYISGILTSVDDSWDGPIGQDDWPLHCTLELNITEVSEDALSYTKVRERGLIQ